MRNNLFDLFNTGNVTDIYFKIESPVSLQDGPFEHFIELPASKTGIYDISTKIKITEQRIIVSAKTAWGTGGDVGGFEILYDSSEFFSNLIIYANDILETGITHEFDDKNNLILNCSTIDPPTVKAVGDYVVALRPANCTFIDLGGSEVTLFNDTENGIGYHSGIIDDASSLEVGGVLLKGSLLQPIPRGEITGDGGVKLFGRPHVGTFEKYYTFVKLSGDNDADEYTIKAKFLDAGSWDLNDGGSFFVNMKITITDNHTSFSLNGSRYVILQSGTFEDSDRTFLRGTFQEDIFISTTPEAKSKFLTFGIGAPITGFSVVPFYEIKEFEYSLKTS